MPKISGKLASGMKKKIKSGKLKKTPTSMFGSFKVAPPPSNAVQNKIHAWLKSYANRVHGGN